MVKFKEMKYQRPDPEALKAALAALVEKLKGAESYAEAKAVFLEKEAQVKRIQTQSPLASVRHSIDTRDEFIHSEAFCKEKFPPRLLRKGSRAALARLPLQRLCCSMTPRANSGTLPTLSFRSTPRPGPPPCWTPPSARILRHPSRPEDG